MAQRAPHPRTFSTGGPLRWSAMVGELVRSHELVMTFAKRDLRARYKQTVLGVGWTVIQPLVFLTVFVVFFGRVAGFEDDTQSYAAFALSALVAWQYNAAIVSGASSALASESAVLRKVYFARLAPVVSRVLSSLPPIVVGVVLMIVLAPVVDGRLTIHLFWIPLLVLLLALPALAVAIPLSALGIWFRDFAALVPFFLQIWLFSSPVAYPATTIESNRLLYAFLNPSVGAIDGFRRVYVEGTAPDFELIGAGLITSVALLLIGLEIFRRLEPGFADVV